MLKLKWVACLYLISIYNKNNNLKYKTLLNFHHFIIVDNNNIMWKLDELNHNQIIWYLNCFLNRKKSHSKYQLLFLVK